MNRRRLLGLLPLIPGVALLGSGVVGEADPEHGSLVTAEELVKRGHAADYAAEQMRRLEKDALAAEGAIMRARRAASEEITIAVFTDRA